jgi:phage gp29-like protein
MTTPTKTAVSRDDDDDKRGRTKAINGVAPKPQPDVQVGVSSFLPWQMPYQGLWEALRTEDITVRELVAMRRTDGQARALYRLITLPIRAALKTSTFVPEEGVDGGEDEALFIQQMFQLPSTGGGMTVPFGRVMAQMLMAVFDGFEAFEMVYWQPTTGPLKGKWTLQKLAHRPSEQLTFLLNDKSEFAALRQQTMYHDRQIDVKIPAEHVVYYAANEEERPFYGLSYFNAAYRHWEAKFKLYVVAQIAAQRAAVGTRVGTMPQNPSREEKVDFQRALADIGTAQWMTIPENWKVESLKEFAGFDFLAYINHHNSQMSKSVLAAFFDDSQGTGGDASLVDFGRQSDSLFLLMLQTIMAEIEEVINTQVIPRFIDWNFDSGKYPLFRFGTMTDEQKGALLDLFKALAVVSPDATSIAPEMFREIERQIADEFGLEVDWEAVEQREEEEAAQAELAMQMQQMNAATGAPDAPDAAGPAIGGDPTTLPAHGAQINPQNVPDGFTLSNPAVDITAMATALLDDAVASLTRGKPNSGGPKFVRSVEGARTYGVPVGTPITRDMQKGMAKHGQKGEKYGRDHSHNPDPTVRHTPGSGGKGEQQGGGKGDTKNVKGQTLGGGKGDVADPGGVNTGAAPGEPQRPQRVYSNPDEPGAQLIDFGDGTVAIRDAQGKMTPRQVFDVNQFAKFGWKVDKNASSAIAAKDMPNDDDKPDGGTKKPTR